MVQEAMQPAIMPQENDNLIIQQAYRELLRSFKDLEPRDKADIRRAFELAARSHSEQRRKSGEPYILHPIAVARICTEEIGLGPTAVVCALLHDVVEDTSVTLKEIHDQFGDRVALIVDGLTKLDGLHDSPSPQADNIAKVLRHMLTDVRVALIKMADRLHNLRTIKSMAPHKQLKIAAETSTIYAPIAHRLGLYQIKTEFQDLCLKITHPEEYRDIAEKLAQTKRARQQYIDEFIAPLREALAEFGINARVTGRAKSIYSIWNKIRNKNVAFEDIYDLFAIRVVVDVPPGREKFTCWQVYSIVTDYYKPIPERLKDWVANPKGNGYESLHTTVIGPDGRYVEVQVRSERMDEIAERGFAAHWKYKGIKGISNSNIFENWLDQVRETLEHNDLSAVEFLADFSSTLFSHEIHVFTPKGDMKILPEGATGLDFAFSIHSDLGCSCQAVKVNNRLVPFDEKLRNGDQVEIITNRSQKPSEGWLQFVTTSRAQNRIRQSLRDEKRQMADGGREILARKLQNNFKVTVEENVDMLAKVFDYANRTEFLSAIQLEQVDLSGMKQRFRAEGNLLVEIVEEKATIPGPAVPEPVRLRPGHAPEVLINGEPGNYYAYSFATCCNPVQGDPIFAYIGAKEGVKIHRSTCPNANFLMANYEYRVLKAEWGNTVKADFVAGLVVIGLDEGPGVIQQITDCIAGLGLNIRSFSISGRSGFFEGRIALVVYNIDQLNMVIQSLKSFSFISSVRRTD